MEQGHEDVNKVHMYSVREEETTQRCQSKPYMVRVEVLNERTGEIIRVKGLIDDGTMVSVMV